MDNIRFILLVSLGLVILLLWQAWQTDYAMDQKDTAGKTSESPVLSDDRNSVPELPTQEDPQTTALTPIEKAEKTEREEVITVITDVFRIMISQKGGDIIQAELLDYPVALDQPDVPVRLLFKQGQDRYIFQGGLISKQAAPTHETWFKSQSKTHKMNPSQDELTVPLEWVSEDGIRVIKKYVFYRGKYQIDTFFEIENNSSQPWSGRAYGQIQRTDMDKGGAKLIYTYGGAVLSSPEQRYEKIDYDDMREEKLSRDVVNGWIAMLQHYFISAIIPASNKETHHFYTNTLPDNRFAVGTITPAVDVPQGNKNTLSYQVYLGPKIQKELAKLADNLELTVDYGVLWFIAKPLFWCLEVFHTVTKNWGWSIILVTLMLKIVFYQLSAAGYRSMAKMRRVQPRLLAIRERFKNDRAKLNQAMMDIYKKEKINPLGGCFPILIQIPVFIALYWVLLESVELRQTPFILWIKDLSAPDPFFVLPLVMGATMLIQQKLNPAPLDPIQEKIMMALPIVFTVFFAFFPSGLVLYWVVNNILSIIQQWMITRKLERSGLT